MSSPEALPPGLLALHGNQTEQLAYALLAWLGAHPLDVLEPEVILVQSSGMAEWLKMRMATQLGLCAAVRFELPGHFLWRSFRQLLGARAVPRHAPLDKAPLTWRLLRLLPCCLQDAAFAPLAALGPDPGQRLHLALRLADLFDQYQNWRSDWLDAWAQGDDVLPVLRADGLENMLPAAPVPPDMLWQPQLWRLLLQDLEPPQREATRSHLHARALHALRSGQAAVQPLPRRVLVFGVNQMPWHLLQFLEALSRRSQVLLAVHNPCRFHWAETISGREWLRMQRRRHPLRGGQDLAHIPLEAMHAHAHPLLAAWGRQIRDHVRQLDALETPATPLQAQWERIDLFDTREERPTAPLLEQVQQRIRDLVPLDEHPPLEVPRCDRSIVFHSAHTLLRELEVLHDALLDMLAAPALPDQPPGQAPLRPRDIVVMLPAIEDAAPLIRAVFGQHPPHDPRHIPFDIADLGARAHSPLVAAVQWLLRLPQQRCRHSELCDLLHVPAVAARFRLVPEDLPQLLHWMADSGLRWGLHARHRAALGLDACGDAGSSHFALERMLLGYACGPLPPGARGPGNIEPQAEIRGLEARLVGALAALVERLEHWWQVSTLSCPPAAWAQHFYGLLQDCFQPCSPADEVALAALRAALERWQAACQQAGFEEAIALDMAGAGWLQSLHLEGLGQRFQAGGVTFCTLMPMRAIPFEVVCLLGMNDGDYPRAALRNSWDLMARPGQQRPGDRLRRDDDRQLMLEALLSARRSLYVSWSGRSVRDNSAQPPSVLVEQLRDYLAAGWCGQNTQGLPRAGRGAELLAQRTQQHPLQPFSRQYFTTGGPHTWAHEWRAAHTNTHEHEHAARPAPSQPPPPPPPPPPPSATDASATDAPAPHPIDRESLARLLRNPADFYLGQRLHVHFPRDATPTPDEEPFALAGLERYRQIEQVQQATCAWLVQCAQPVTPQDMADHVAHQAQRLLRAGALPLGNMGQHAARELAQDCTRPLQLWWQYRQDFPLPLLPRPWRLECAGATLEAPPADLYRTADGRACCCLLLTATRMLDKQGKPRPDKLLDAWLRALLLAASGTPADILVCAPDGRLQAPLPEARAARQHLADLLHLWGQARQRPLPLPPRAALRMAQGKEPDARKAFEGSGQAQEFPENRHPAWQRLYPDFDSLCADGQFATLSLRIHAPVLHWAQNIEATPHPS